jgi:hypothetical protein
MYENQLSNIFTGAIMKEAKERNTSKNTLDLKGGFTLCYGELALSLLF